MKKAFVLALGLVSGAQMARAQDSDIIVADLKISPTQITVTATGLPTHIDQSGQSISTIGLPELQQVQGPDITRALERLPGVSIARSGSLGSQTSVFVRGANSEQLMVLIDGVKVEDPSAPSGGYDFGNLMSGGIGKVELLRGSNSVAWGSDAMAGVLNVATREINGAEASVEGGSRNSWDANASAGISRSAYALTVNGGYTATTGISAAANGTEPDGFHQWHVSAKGRLELAEGLALVAVGRYATGKLQMDGYPAPAYTFADDREYQTNKQGSGRAGLTYDGGLLTLAGGVAYAQTSRSYYDADQGPAPQYSYQGHSTRGDLTGRLDLPKDLKLDFGADSEWTSFYDTYDARASARLTSGHALLGWSTWRASLTGGVRVDDHSAFGTHWTFGANGTMLLVDDVRLRASYGQGFKAPTLYQLYAQSYGNTALKAETSNSYDVALEKGDRNGRLHGAVTWFHRDTDNLIDFVSCAGEVQCASRPYGTYANVSRAHAQGIEVEADAGPVEALQLHGAYTYTQSTNRTQGSALYGLDLARRPRHLLTAAADWTTPWHGLAIGGQVRLAGASWDDAANTVHLASYVMGDLMARLPVMEKLELFGRIENVGDNHVQSVSGYGVVGRSVVIGARARI